jgi:hypothetical protein
MKTLIKVYTYIHMINVCILTYVTYFKTYTHKELLIYINDDDGGVYLE